MIAKPKAAAWQQDEFWKELVSTMTGGKKLRGEHYLWGLSESDLEQLRLCLSSAATFAEMQPIAPKRRGGPSDGKEPGIDMLQQLSQAMRQMWMLRGIERKTLIESAAKERCGNLGLNSQLTDAVVRIVGEEALAEHARGVVDKFALNAAKVLIRREAQVLDREVFEFDAAKACLSKLPELKLISNDKTLSTSEKVQAVRMKLFGVLPPVKTAS